MILKQSLPRTTLRQGRCGMGVCSKLLTLVNNRGGSKRVAEGSKPHVGKYAAWCGEESTVVLSPAPESSFASCCRDLHPDPTSCSGGPPCFQFHIPGFSKLFSILHLSLMA